MSPALAAGIAIATVVVAVLLARPAEPTPAPYPPLPPDPTPPDRAALSLDRCAAALRLADLDGGYPDRSGWEPLARFTDGEVVAAVLAGPVPFVCATGPTTVEVSDPGAAVAAGGALLLLTAPSGVVAAVAPAGGTVAVDGSAPADVVLHRGPPAADPAPPVLVVGGPDGPGGGTGPVAAARPAPPALRVVDRREIPADRSAEAVGLLQRCVGVAEPDRFWVPAVALDMDGTALLVVVGSASVGGCVVAPGRAEPVRLWRIGGPTDGPRPFVWLTAPPGVGPDVAAGPAQPRLARLEVTAPTGQTWTAAVGGRAFATRLPPGVAPDPAALTVRAFDAEGTLLYAGPAA